METEQMTIEGLTETYIIDNKKETVELKLLKTIQEELRDEGLFP